MTRPENVLRVSWEPGQLVLFDGRQSYPVKGDASHYTAVAAISGGA